jgi:hypothetical protein
MISKFALVFTTLISVALNISPARAVTYTATLLHPATYTKSYANDASATSQVGAGRGDTHPSLDHALLWQSTSGSVVDLHPANFAQSFALGASETNQVGYGQESNGATNHALLWSGTAESAVNLQPAKFSSSVATAVSGNQQVGYGRIVDVANILPIHALLWSGTAASAIDLHPAKFDQSQAYDISGTSQVGGGSTSGNNHALLWHGAAAGVVDLHPAGFNASTAWAVDGQWQVGEGKPTGPVIYPHALLWHGTAASMIDLNPPGFTYSTANDISMAGQVGAGRVQFEPTHAMYWNGSAESGVDLHPFLSGLGIDFVESIANGISDNGSIAGFAYDNSRNQYAVFWTPVPEAPTFLLVACGIALTLLARGTRHPRLHTSSRSPCVRIASRLRSRIPWNRTFSFRHYLFSLFLYFREQFHETFFALSILRSRDPSRIARDLCPRDHVHRHNLAAKWILIVLRPWHLGHESSRRGL